MKRPRELLSDLPSPGDLPGEAEAALPDAVDLDADTESKADGLEMPEVRTAIVPAAFHGQRLDKFLVTLAPEFSRNHVQHLVELAQVSLDAVTALSSSKRLQAGQGIAVTLLPTAESSAFRPEPMALAILFEDEHLMVVNKPAGLVVHPAAGHWSGTLLNGLLAHHAGAARLPRAGIVHRLDKDTSGLMVVAKSLVAHTALVRAIAAREVHREYLALAWGSVRPEAFSIEAPIGRDPVSRVRMAVVASGKAARTDIWCLHTAMVVAVPAAGEAGRPVSLVRCQLHSGRTHQIRVHLQSRGSPLVADAVYGGKVALGMVRQALHARRLEFKHPVSGQDCRFSAELPKDFVSALHLLEGFDLPVATI